MKILLAGDSTVANQPIISPYDPAECHCGWGQMLELFFDNTTVHNFALNGRTVETFRTEGVFDELKELCEKGDYVFIQFGHNDQKRAHLRSDIGYDIAIRNYINEIRSLGAMPILVTSVCRNQWRGDNGEFNDLLIPYVNQIKIIATDMNVPMLDLNKVSKNWLLSLGREDAKKYFFPGDYTHPNDFGGLIWANFIADLLVENNHCDLYSLKKYLKVPNDYPTVPMRGNNIGYDISKIKNLICGWTTNPAHKDSTLEHFVDIDIMTVADTLLLAKTVFGFFVSVHVDTTDNENLYYCAFENGYLPSEIDKNCLSNNIEKDLFEKIMFFACACRNDVSNIKLNIASENEINGKDAIEYAIELESIATGAIVKESAYKPKGQ